MKTNKAHTKRLRTTKTGKIIAKVPGRNHFNAKEPRVKQLARKRTAPFAFGSNKTRHRFLPNS